MTKTPVIFLALANDLEDYGRTLRKLVVEKNAIEEALGRATSGPNPVCELVIKSDVTIDKIFDTFQDKKFRDRIAIFHYAGHAGTYSLLLEDKTGGKAPVNAKELVPFLASQHGLQLIFLNGCATKSQAEDYISSGVPAVIGTSRDIPDQLAWKIAERFYSGLGAGLSLDRAWQEAVNLVRTDGKSETKIFVDKWNHDNDGLPWEIHYQKSDKAIREWNLPDAAENPIFGLPEINDKYYLHLPESPYIGLTRFQREHAGIFFGRNSEIRKLIDKIKGISPVILYYGQSGVGKSSLLEAGLIPRIEDSHQVKVIRRIQNPGLLQTLEKGLNELLTTSNLQDEITSNDLSILELWKKVERIQTDRSVIFILDQVEETYTKPWSQDSDELSIFCNGIKPLTKYLEDPQKGKLILAFRSEFLPQIQDSLNNSNIPKTDLMLSPLGKGGIHAAITGVSRSEHAADHYKLTEESIEAGLPEEIAHDLLKDRHSPIAPMLQILLAKLWDKSEKTQEGGRMMCLDTYSELREKGLALSDFVNEQLSILKAKNIESTSPFHHQEVEQSGLVLNILRNFVTAGGTADAKDAADVLARYNHRTDIIKPLIEHLKKARLLNSFRQNDIPLLALSHDTLAPIVRELHETSDLPGQRAQRILQNEDWWNTTEENLFSERQVEIIEVGISGMKDLGEREKLLLKKSKAEVKRRKIRRNVYLGLGAFAIASIMTLGWVLFANNQRETRRLKAESLEVQADRNSSNPQEQLKLLSESLSLRDDDLVKQKWYKIYRENIFHDTLFMAEGVYDAVISPNGRFIAAAVQEGLKFPVHLYEYDGKEIRFLREMSSVAGNTINSLVFSGDGQYIHAGGTDRRIHTWNLQGDSLPNQRLDAVIRQLYSSDAGEIVMMSSQKNEHLEVWDVRRNQQIDSIRVGRRIVEIYENHNISDVAIAEFIKGDEHLQEPESRIAIEKILETPESQPTPETETRQILKSNLDPIPFQIIKRISRTFYPEKFSKDRSHEMIAVPYSDRIYSANENLSYVDDVSGPGYLWRNTDAMKLFTTKGTSNPIVYFFDNPERLFTIEPKSGSSGDLALFKSWNIPNYQPTKTFYLESGSIMALRLFSRGDEILLAASTRMGLWVINLSNSQIDSTHSMIGQVITAIDVGNEHILTGNTDGFYSIYSKESLSKIGELMPGKSGVKFVDVSNDGHYALGGNLGYFSLYDIDSQKEIFRIENKYFKDRNFFRSVNFIEDGSQIIALHGNIKFWNLDSPILQDSVPAHPKEATDMFPLFKEDKLFTIYLDTLYISSLKGDLVRKVNTGTAINLLKVSTDSPGYCAMTTKDGQLLICDYDGNIFQHFLLRGRGQATALDILGDHVVTGNSVGQIEVWKITDPVPTPTTWKPGK